MSADEAAKAINMTLINYKMGANEAIKVLDIWNEVQNNFRTSAEDLAEAIGKTGSIAKQAGVPLEKLAGYVTAIVSATGISGNEAGTMLKSVMSRTFRIGEEGMDDPGKVESTLADPKIGIAIRKNEKEFRAFDDILLDVAKKWKTLDGVTKQTIADSMAGRHMCPIMQ